MDPRITFDFHGRCIIRQNEKINLTGTQFKLMSRMIRGDSVSIEVLRHEILDDVSADSLRRSMSALRCKLQGPEGYPEMIKNDYGHGYRLSIENMDILD